MSMKTIDSAVVQKLNLLGVLWPVKQLKKTPFEKELPEGFDFDKQYLAKVSAENNGGNFWVAIRILKNQKGWTRVSFLQFRYKPIVLSDYYQYEDTPISDSNQIIKILATFNARYQYVRINFYLKN